MNTGLESLKINRKGAYSEEHFLVHAHGAKQAVGI